MTKLKKLRFGLLSAVGLLVVVSIVAVGLVVSAYTSNGEAPKVVIENGDFIEAQQPVIESISEPNLGALTSPNIESQYLSVNGDITYRLTGDFINASTTIVSVPDPFLMSTTTASDVVISGTYPNGYTGATSTVELVRLNIDVAATSTAEDISCGASVDPYTTPTYVIIDSDQVATSSIGVIENGIATAVNQGIGGGTIQKIMLTPSHPYLVCKVTAALTGGFIGANNTFAGRYMIRISKTR